MQVVAVNIDPSVPLAQWREWWRSFDERAVLWAQDTDFQAVQAFDVQYLGTKIILNRRGEVVRKSAGTAGYENLRRWIEEALVADLPPRNP